MATAPIDGVSADRLKDLLTCQICSETVTDPRTLPCFHSYCTNCLESFVKGLYTKGVELNCPKCLTKFTLGEEGVKGMELKNFILNMLDLMAIQNQTRCIPCAHKCEGPSVGGCTECKKFMCEECLEKHNEFRGFHDHLVLSMVELSKPENKGKIEETPLCKIHKGKKLKLYCKTCEKIICRDCEYSDEHPRPEHICVLLQTVADKRKLDLNAHSKALDEMLRDGNETLAELNKYSQSLDDNMETTERGINDTKNKILREIEQTLKEKSQTLIDDARMIFNVKKKAINGKINEVKSYIDKVSGTSNMSKVVLENGKYGDIISTQNETHKSLERLQNEIPEGKSCVQKEEAYDVNQIETILKDKIVATLGYDVEAAENGPESSDSPETSDAHSLEPKYDSSPELKGLSSKSSDIHKHLSEVANDKQVSSQLEFDPTTGKLQVRKVKTKDLDLPTSIRSDFGKLQVRREETKDLDLPTSIRSDFFGNKTHRGEYNKRRAQKYVYTSLRKTDDENRRN